jgi:hypothetical protein
LGDRAASKEEKEKKEQEMMIGQCTFVFLKQDDSLASCRGENER